MYLANGPAISCIPKSVSIVMGSQSLLARCVSSHLSCACDGQRSKKCSGVSSSSPQAGQRALSTLLMRLRYLFTGACPSLNCAIRLASMRLSSALASHFVVLTTPSSSTPRSSRQRKDQFRHFILASVDSASKRLARSPLTSHTLTHTPLRLLSLLPLGLRFPFGIANPPRI